MKGPRHASASAAPAKASAAEDVLALLEANLQPPSIQHKLSALRESAGPPQLAADDVREIDKLLFTPAPSQRAVTHRHGSANDVYSSESAMQQLPRPPDPGYNIAVQQPMAVYADAHTARQFEQQDHGWVMDMPAYGGAQGSFAAELLPTDHRCDHTLPMKISAILFFQISLKSAYLQEDIERTCTPCCMLVV